MPSAWPSLADARVGVAEQRSMVGSAVRCALERDGVGELVGSLRDGGRVRMNVGEAANLVGYGDRIVGGASRPDGTSRKYLDIAPLTPLGWSPTIGASDGIAATHEWFAANALDGARDAG